MGVAGFTFGGGPEHRRHVAQSFHVGLLREVKVATVGLRLGGEGGLEVFFGPGTLERHGGASWCWREECAAADEALLRLDPRDIHTGDLMDEAQNWIFSFATKDSLRWLKPGIVRVALAASPPRPAVFFDLISQRTTDLFSDEQWLVILDLAEVCCSNGWITREALGMMGPAGKGDLNES